MICRKPYVARGVPFGCGQCVPCRVNRRRQWMWRQFLESLCHEENCFITLTYAPGNEPGNAGHHPHAGHLAPEDLRLWLHRFRKALRPARVRFFAVGEYGEENGRPHYHLSMFGVSATTLVSLPSGPVLVGSRKSQPGLVETTWGRGLVDVAEFNERTAQYVAGYVTKKIGGSGNFTPDGRPQEFARQSRNPGLGANAAKILADAWLLGIKNRSPPSELKIGKRTIPLGRYLLQKLREACNLTPQQISDLKAESGYEDSVELSLLLADAIAASPHAPVTKTQIYLERTKQAAINIETRTKLYKQRKRL